MTKLNDLTISQLNRVIAIKEQIESLQGQLDSITPDGGSNGAPTAFATTKKKKKRRMSAAGRRAIAAAARARWAEYRGNGAAKLKKPAATGKKRRKFSAAA